jgi:hypothetical protein
MWQLVAAKMPLLLTKLTSTPTNKHTHTHIHRHTQEGLTQACGQTTLRLSPIYPNYTFHEIQKTK